MNGNGHGTRRPEEIQAEIARTRREMDGTLSAIETRLSPGQIYDQGIAYLKNNGGTEFLQNLSRQAKANPMPVALAGISLAWLMAAGKSSGDGSATSAAYGTGERALDTARSSIGSARQKLGDTASAVRDQASHVAERAGQMRDATREQIGRAKSGVDTMMREQPLALGAIGLAIGALAAALAPRTRTEDRMVGPMRDELAHKAGEQVKASAPSSASYSAPDATQGAREQERSRMQEGVRPYAERKSSEPPV